MKNAPCYECDIHTPYCHAYCPEYAAWVAEREAERAERKKPKDADAHTKATIAKNCKRAQTLKQVGRM